jgi:DNA-binding MarR family transcriptional regulator
MAEPADMTALVLAIFRAHQALVNEGDRRVGPIGLNSARWKVLGAISLGEQPLTAAEIGRRMGLSRQGAQKQVDLLCEEGLAQRVRNPAHARVPLYDLTETGRTVYAQADAVWSGWAGELARDLEDGRLRDARGLLDQISRALESQRREEP